MSHWGGHAFPRALLGLLNVLHSLVGDRLAVLYIDVRYNDVRVVVMATPRAVGLFTGTGVVGTVLTQRKPLVG